MGAICVDCLQELIERHATNESLAPINDEHDSVGDYDYDYDDDDLVGNAG